MLQHEYIEDLSFEEFKVSNLKTDAVIRNLEIIGETSKNVPDHIKVKHPEFLRNKELEKACNECCSNNGFHLTRTISYFIGAQVKP